MNFDVWIGFFLSWSFLYCKCVDGWIYSLTCKCNFNAIFFHFAAYISYEILSILELIVECIYDINMELCFYLAYLHVWAMIDECIFLEIELSQ